MSFIRHLSTLWNYNRVTNTAYTLLLSCLCYCCSLYLLVAQVGLVLNIFNGLCITVIQCIDGKGKYLMDWTEMDVLSSILRKDPTFCPGIIPSPYRKEISAMPMMLSKKIGTSNNKTLEYINGLAICVSVFVISYRVSCIPFYRLIYFSYLGLVDWQLPIFPVSVAVHLLLVKNVRFTTWYSVNCLFYSE